jgi:hypothetical protein
MSDPGSVAAPNGADAPGDAAHAAGGHPPVDVQQLADKVYALMVAEARVGHARTEPATVAARSREV